MQGKQALYKADRISAEILHKTNVDLIGKF